MVNIPNAFGQTSWDMYYFICFIREKLRENYRGKLSAGDKCTCTHLRAQGAQIGVCIAQEYTLNAECH